MSSCHQESGDFVPNQLAAFAGHGCGRKQRAWLVIRGQTGPACGVGSLERPRLGLGRRPRKCIAENLDTLEARRRVSTREASELKEKGMNASASPTAHGGVWGRTGVCKAARFANKKGPLKRSSNDTKPCGSGARRKIQARGHGTRHTFLMRLKQQRKTGVPPLAKTTTQTCVRRAPWWHLCALCVLKSLLAVCFSWRFD